MSDSFDLMLDLTHAICDSCERDQITHVRTVLPVETVLGALETLQVENYHATSGGGMDEHEASFVEAWSVGDQSTRDWRIRVAIESQVGSC